jgi:hypothetical protein
MATKKYKWVNSFLDHNGVMRNQFRRTGHPKKLIPGLPCTDAFDEAYNILVEKTGGAPTIKAGVSRTKPGTFNVLIPAYLKDGSFTKGLSQASQNMRRPILNKFRETAGPSGQPYGEKQVATMQERHVEAILESKTPDAQRNWLKAFRGLMKYAFKGKFRSDDPSKNLKAGKRSKSLGHMPWDWPQVEQYRRRHAIGTMARVALELLINIAARRFDTHEIGEQNVIRSNRDGVRRLCWRPHKTLRTTGKQLKIRILPSLQEALDAMPKPERGVEVPLAFVLNEYGKPFASAAAFGNRFADWCTQAGLGPVVCEDGKTRNYRAHGLRKFALTALAYAGAELPELMAVSGHKKPEECLLYIEQAEQERLADAGMKKLMAAGEAKTATGGD